MQRFPSDLFAVHWGMSVMVVPFGCAALVGRDARDSGRLMHGVGHGVNLTMLLKTHFCPVLM